MCPKDVYRLNAAKRLGIPVEQVTWDQRQEQKERDFLAWYCATPARIEQIITQKRGRR